MQDFLEWRDNTPVSSHFDDVYYSVDDGLAESRHVFLSQNDLPLRWQTFADKEFCILETGFGTGLNFIASWQLWRQTAPKDAWLHYVSIEKYPLSAQQIHKALAHWPELQRQVEALTTQLPPPIPGWHTLYFNADRLRLTLIFCDISDALAQLSQTNIRADAIFLDGFSPEKNPAMWADAVLASLANQAKPSASIASFTAVGRIRRQLQQCGFAMQKVKGFGRKREMIRGVLHVERPKTLAWYCDHNNRTPPQRVAVIGAGIAGAHIAYRLACAGLQVDVYDKAEVVASQASGNHQGVVFIKLSAGDGTLAEFSLASYLHSLRFYKSLLDSGQMTEDNANFCGMLQLCDNDTWQRLRQKFGSYTEFVHFIEADAASAIAGTSISQKAMWFHTGGCIHPPALCRAMLQHANIKVHLNAKVTALSHATDWQLQIGTAQHSADAVVLCNGVDSTEFSQGYQLPIKAAPGQTTQFKASAEHSELKCVVCHRGYAAPPYQSIMSIGASFRMTHNSLEPLASDDDFNIASFHAALPNLPVPTNVSSRVAVRAASGDYLPLAGPLPDVAAFMSRFESWRTMAKTKIPEAGVYIPGLYSLTGLGSRGLSYAPICADIVCEQILGRNQGVDPKLYQALQPARFLVRGLKRNNTDALC